MYSLDRHYWREYVKHPIALFRNPEHGAETGKNRGRYEVEVAPNPLFAEKSIPPELDGTSGDFPRLGSARHPLGGIIRVKHAGEVAVRSGQLYLRYQEPLYGRSDSTRRRIFCPPRYRMSNRRAANCRIGPPERGSHRRRAPGAQLPKEQRSDSRSL